MIAALGLGVLFFLSGGEDPSTEEAKPAPWFRDATAESGVRFTHDWGATPERHLPETMGAGAAIFDANEDGLLDIYFVQGGPFPPRAGDDLPTNRLYLNRGGSFESGDMFVDATAQSGDAAHTGYGMAVTCGDANGDGHTDLFVTNFGRDVLLLGDGAGSFTDATESAGLIDDRWTAGAVFFDADGDGDQDLYVTAYLAIDVDDPQWCGRREQAWRSYCHPDNYQGLHDRYWENQGDGTFRDRTEQAGLADNRGKGLGVVAWDLDGDRDLDLYIANDSTENRMWSNDGEGGFSDSTLLSGTGVSGDGLTEAGMGIAVGDVDHDQRPDLLVTNYDNESNTLYVNNGRWFRDQTLRSGLDAPSRILVGFGVALADFDHDAHLDLVVANGHIIHNIDLYNDGKTHAQVLQLYRGGGDATFQQVPPDEAGDAFGGSYVGRGLYTGDLDNDGDLDLVLTQCGGPALILENLAPQGSATIFRGLEPGCRVDIDSGSSEVTRSFRSGGSMPSYFGHSATELHMTLGDADQRIEGYEIVHPDGKPAGTVRGRPRPVVRLELGPDGKYVEPRE